MKPLLRVTRDESAGIALYYLSYAPCGPGGVAKTLSAGRYSPLFDSADDDLAIFIDLDADGNLLGIELIDPKREQLERLALMAREHGLSLDGFDVG